jgi:hypothetical protein
MADSAESKDKPQAEKPSEAIVVVVKNTDGSLRESLRTPNGTFAKKPKPLLPTIEFTRAERKKLNSVRSDKDGMTEYMVAFMNLVRIAQYDGEDPKAKMAAVKAFEVIRLSALGKPAPSEQELDKLTNQPVKTIIVVAPELMNPQVINADKVVQKPRQPSFAEVTGVVTNPKK